jgi:Flp pilus assembly protein TadB
MGLVSIIKVNKYKRFSFTPRYYDERKERREELIKQLEEDQRRAEDASIGYSSRLKSGYLKSMRTQSKKKEGNSSLYRLLIIIAALSALFYWLLQ